MNLLPANWMRELEPHIEPHDFIFVGSMSVLGQLPKRVDWNKVILYNWDHYAHVDYGRPDWVAFHAACKKAREIWMPTHAHCSYFKAYSGLDSYALNVACVLPDEWGGTEEGEYAMFSSRPDRYKRFDLFKSACKKAGIPYVATHPKTTDRKTYIKLLSGCKVYVQPSLDESLGGLSLMEAAYLGKRVIMSDTILGGKEMYGDTIEYFKDEDHLADLLAMNKTADIRAKAKVYTPEMVGKLINRRIRELTRSDI